MATIKHSIIVPASSQSQQVDIEIPITVRITAIGSTTTTTTKASTTTTTTKAATTTTTTKAPSTTTTTTKMSSSYLTLPLSSARDLSGQSNIVIENLRFENVSGIALKIHNGSNITIRNCFFNKAGLEAIDIQQSSNITVTNCLFNGVETCVYALDSQGIKVNNNQFVNVRKRPDNSRGQFVQFNSCGGAGNEIIGNRGENFAGESNPEDLISMYASSGIPSSWIQIKNNVFRGGGPSTSGGGIMLGDGAGQYLLADGNILLDPGQYGMAASGGNNIQISNNKIFAKQAPYTNIALYVANYSGSPCGTNIIVKTNRASWINKDGVSNVAWNSGDCGNIIFENPTPITQSELGIPAHLITFVTPEELLNIRK